MRKGNLSVHVRDRLIHYIRIKKNENNITKIEIGHNTSISSQMQDKKKQTETEKE